LQRLLSALLGLMLDWLDFPNMNYATGAATF
jgi:hypothetical protein